MSLTTPSRGNRNNPGIESILEGLIQTDFDAPGAPDPADQLYMLSQAELNKRRKKDEFAALATEILHWRSIADTMRMSHEQQWLQNLDMYEGRQFHRWDPTTRTSVEKLKSDGEVRIPMNFIQPVIRTELAKTASSHPTASVQPASNDDDDILAARAAEAVWEWAYSQEKVQSRVLNQANFWRAITGNGFVKTFVDLHAEDTAATAAAKQAFAEESARPQPLMGQLGAAPEPEAVYGKVSFAPVNPFHLFFGDLLEPDIQKQPWIIQAALLPVERAKMIYKDVMPPDWEPKKVTQGSVFDYSRLGLRNDYNGVDQTLVLEAWIKPNVTRNLPQGGLVVLVDDEIVAMSEDGLPYEHNEFPYQHIYTVETGRFYRSSVIDALTPLQDEFNRIFAQLIRYKNMASAPQWFYRQGSTDPTRIRNTPGQWIPITLGMDMPVPVQLAEMPQYVMSLIDAIKSVVDDISGQHQVSRATSPGADMAASAISILRESDDDYLSNTQDSIETCVESMARQYLICAVQTWDQPRLIKVTGSSEHLSAKMLTGAEIASGTDIRTTVGSGLPQSRSARQALVKELMDGGYVPPNMGLKIIAEGALGKMFSQITVDEDYAERINVEMEKITEAEVQAFQQTQATAMQEFAQEDPETAQLAVQAEDEGLAPAPSMLPPQFAVKDWENFTVSREVIERKMKSQSWLGFEPWRQDLFEQRWRELAEREAATMAPDPAMMEGDVAGAGGDESYTEDAGPGSAPSSEMSEA